MNVGHRQAHLHAGEPRRHRGDGRRVRPAPDVLPGDANDDPVAERRGTSDEGRCCLSRCAMTIYTAPCGGRSECLRSLAGAEDVPYMPSQPTMAAGRSAGRPNWALSDLSFVCRGRLSRDPA
jgi:hypothetical protein